MKNLFALGAAAMLAATLVSAVPAQAVVVNTTATASCAGTDTCRVVPIVQPIFEGVGINRPVTVNYAFLNMASINLTDINGQPGTIFIDFSIGNSNPSPTITFSLELGLFDKTGGIIFQAPLIPNGQIPGEMQLINLREPLSVGDPGVEFFGLQLAFTVSTQTSAELTLFGVNEIDFSGFNTDPIVVPEPPIMVSEPTTLALFLIALGGLGVSARRRFR